MYYLNHAEEDYLPTISIATTSTVINANTSVISTPGRAGNVGFGQSYALKLEPDVYLDLLVVSRSFSWVDFMSLGVTS